MGNQSRLRAMFWRRTFSALIDIIFIYCASYLVHQWITRSVFIGSFIVFAVTWILYYLVGYIFLNGRTLAKVITGLQVTANNGEVIGIKHFLVREGLSKFLILLVIPAYILNGLHLYTRSQLLVPSFFILAIVIIVLGLFFIFKKPWWELISSTKTVRDPVVHKPLRSISFMAILGVYAMTVFIKINPVFSDNKDFSTKFYPEYPVNAETRRYADFIKTHSRNPVDYVFDLFDRYDLVVLNERVPHSEYTQYELITRIVRDKRFASKIGNIYTELGSISFQDTLNRYLNTVFPGEDSLNKATAFLQRNSNPIWPLWDCTNLFDFLKSVNGMNTSSADSLKINWYFTDIPVNWETMTPENYRRLPLKEKRDKLMADHIVDVYKNKLAKNERRKKGLVIMNARHGYGLIRDIQGKKTDHYFNKTNTTAFLMDMLPGKVCNVLINTVPFGLGIIFIQVQNGKWDRAFSLAGNPEAGFDFENSPFGSDKFDGSIGFPPDELRYKDVFTGFIFYKPLEQHVNKTGCPYMFYNFEDSLMRRAGCISPSYQESMKNMIETYRNDKTISGTIPYAFFYNLIINLGFSLIIFFTLIICLVFYLKK
jgi:hypothetical protein